jgi:hypothetical protein
VDHNCSVKPHWPLVNAALRGALADISLVQLARGPLAEPPMTEPEVA